jgi:hypothetical protein
LTMELRIAKTEKNVKAYAAYLMFFPSFALFADATFSLI